MVHEHEIPEMKGKFQPKKVPSRPPSLKRKDMVEHKYRFEDPPKPIPSNEIKETILSEVVVVGAGISGLAAAISAVESRSKVVLLEKTKICQGNGIANAFIGSGLQKKLGIDIDRDEVVMNLMKYSAHRPDQRLIRMWAYDSGATADWLMDMTDAAGIETIMHQFPPPPTYNNDDEYYPQYLTNHMYAEGEAVLAKCFKDNAIKKGVKIYFETRAKQLLCNNTGRVIGVIAQNTTGNYIQFNAAKAVVLCTGDYGANAEMVAKYCPQVNELGTTHFTATGDGHQMAMWVGATMEPVPHAPMVHGIPGPLGTDAFLQVNLRGERFHNEDVPCECYVAAVLRQPGQEAWQVFDSKYPEQLQCMGLGIGKNYFMTDQLKEQVEAQCVASNSIEELAGKMKVPKETFKATVSRYNEMARGGKDLDFAKSANRLFAIDKPPFYAGKGYIWFICVLGGLNVNTLLQPVDKDGNVIPGLFLGGNVAGNRYGVEYPSMCAGLSNGMAIHFGRVAGLNAAKYG